ncbi:MAG: arsenate reductase family protein [Pyrinomonadaceae bacterium]
MRKLDIYWLPHCSTCKKAVAFLESKGVEFNFKRDIKEEKLSRKEIERLASFAGGADSIFSRRAIKYRTMKLNERELSEKEMIRLMADEYTFIKRPLVVDGAKVVAGYSERKYEELLGGNQ